MGCFESKEEQGIDPHNLAYERYYRETRYVQAQTSLPVRPKPAQGPFYGQYHCKNCNRRWCSRFSWPDKYQICKKCRRHIFPYTHRELKSTDFDNDLEESKEHQKELCQMCQQLGHLCTKDKALPNINRRRKIH